MKYLIAIMAVLLLAVPSRSQTPDDEAAAALALARASKKASAVCDCLAGDMCTCGKACDCGLTKVTYAEGCKLAVANGYPLVTFFGAPYRLVTATNFSGIVSCYADSLPGYPSTRLGIIVIAVPNGSGWLDWRVTLPGDATDAQIRAACSPKAVQPVATPFTSSPVEREGSVTSGQGCENGQCNAQQRGILRRR